MEMGILFPKRFIEPEKEILFITEFRRTGVQFAKIAALAGAATALAFALLMLGSEGRDLNQEKRQIIRVSLAALFLVVGGLIRYRPEVVERNYVLVVGVVAALACYTVALLGFLPTEVNLPRSARLTIAMSVTCFMVYGFTRLPVPLSTGICTSAAALAVVGSIRNGDDYVSALVIYLAMTNLSGAVLAMQIEARERNLFARTIELTKAREELALSAKESADASAAKSYILAAVNHDLRQPVMSALLYLEALKADGAASGGAQLQTISKIQECLGAINDSLSRLSAGSLPEGAQEAPEVCAVSMTSIFKRVEAVYSAPASCRRVDIKFVCRRGDDLFVATDGPKLCDVLSNLISNAIKFADSCRKSRVVVFAAKFRSLVRITVVDNGIGIERKFHGQVFEEYFRVPGFNVTDAGGRGLGLSIVKGLLERLPGHEIRMKSEFGGGSRFDVILPAWNTRDGIFDVNVQSQWWFAEGQKSPLTTSSAVGDFSLAGVYALVVEDDPRVRCALVDTMERWGMLVEAADSASEAIEVSREAERLFDVVVSDFGLPGGTDGISLIDALREEQGQRTPAIIISGQVPSIDSLRLRRMNVRALPKPIDPRKLKIEIGVCVSRDQLIR